MQQPGIPRHVRITDREFISQQSLRWLGAFASLTLTIEPTSRMSIAKPLHGKLRAECLNGTIVYSLGDRKS